MLIVTTQLPPDQVPLIGMPDREALEQLCLSIVDTLGSIVGDVNHPSRPELVNLAKAFSNGKNCVYLCVHSEPALVQATRGRG